MENTVVADRTSSCSNQWGVLLRRKELLLKRRRCCTTVCELVLPVILCATLVLGANSAEIERFNTAQYVPASVAAALEALGPMQWGTYRWVNPTSGAAAQVPTSILPLPLFLAYASMRGMQPFDGTYLAVTPDSPEVRGVVDAILSRPVEPWMTNSSGPLGQTLCFGGSCRSLPPPSTRPVPVRYFASGGQIDSLAKDRAPIWAAIAFESVPAAGSGSGTLRYSLRFNNTALPATRRLYDRFPQGISTEFFQYYTTGFLSLQTALNEYALRNQSSWADSPPLPIGVPFPVAAYERNTFFAFAGNLIGLVVVFSFLIPISTALRALVLEKESKLREQLLMMGATLPSYYGAVFTNYGTTFLITALICAIEIGVSCYPHSDGSLVAILFILFALAALAFTLALSPFFRNARVAALVGPLVFFITSQLYNVFLDRGVLSEGQTAGKWAASLFPTMAFYLGASLMAQFESSNQGVSWETAFESGGVGGFGVGQSIVMLIVDIFLYLFIAWYLDQVVPSEYGLQKPFYFLCTPSYWRGDGGKANGEEEDASPSLSEPPLAVEPLQPPLDGTSGVCVKNLAKIWKVDGKTVVAVAGLELDMPAGQITGLLGANGAGKTTTISMLTGLIQPSSGRATIDGKSITTEMQSIRHSLGVCPQLNVIFEPLTPVQHLHMYGALKGLHGAELEQAIDDMLKHVMLVEKRHTESKSLSGGQKRKLCLAIALIGQPRTVFLDEPTSGMDPHSRRSIWALLREQRVGRTIVLTTHFLDEAEILSDRIAIMAEGQLRCVGSPLFLKDHFGTGYSLALTKAPHAAFDTAKLLGFVQEHVSDAAVLNESQLEVTIRLPGDDLDAFGRLFHAIEPRLDSLGVREYGATCTTLEDVFLKINENALQRLDGTAPSASEEAHPDPHVVDVAAPADEAAASEASPSVVAVGEMAQMPAATLRRCMHRSRLFRSLYLKRALSARRDWCSTLCLIMCPVVLVWLALALLAISSSFGAAPDPLPMLPNDVFRESQQVPNIPRPVPMMQADGNVLTTMPSFLPTLQQMGWNTQDFSAAVDANTFPTVAQNLSDVLLASPSGRLPSAIAFSPSTPVGVPGVSVGFASLLFNTTSYHSLPCLVDSFYNGLLQATTNGAASIAGTIHSLPLSSDDEAQISQFVALFASIMILIPFAFIPAQFITPLVREREEGSKQMQFISGVGPVVYWLSNWAWDSCMYLIIEVCVLLIFLIQGRDEFTGNAEKFGATTLLLLLFGFAVLPLSSAASFLFKTPSSGLIAMIGFHFLTGFGLVITEFVLSSIDSTKSTAESLSNLFRLFPTFCLGQGFRNLSTREVVAQADFGPAASPPGVYEWDVLGGSLTFLAVIGFVSIGATLALQYAESDISLQQRLHSRSLRMSAAASAAAAGSGSNAAATPAAPAAPASDPSAGVEMPSPRRSMSTAGLEDSDVREERQAVDGGDTADSMLVISHLRREFGPKTAVRDLCLRIGSGECFGFLGVNGAGKSTTFSMLTGSLVPTSGDARLRGMSILSDQNAIRRLVGYCPQHDALEKLMTARETLRMYAEIKQVPADQIEAEVDGLIRDLDLGKFADKPAGTYSGGNKRKLCVGLALVGSPQLVLLDEPSSGMDAASKRFLWSVIKRRTAACCTVLTTHSMEECEALCGRLAVMVDGTLRCLGPIQRLKTTYGQGYKLDLRFDTAKANPTATLQHLEARCEGLTLNEHENASMVLTAPRGSATLAELFALLRELKAEHHVLECSVTQCTLEQIFIQMASKTTTAAAADTV